MQLWVGLGNPGKEYENTRHNVGFAALDFIARTENASFESSAKFFADIAKTPFAFLLKPTTFMNRSGQAVAALAHFYKIPTENIVIFHDDLDLMPGQIRFKQGGANAGHNGLKSIEANLANKNFWRMRIGIGHPRTLQLPHSVVDFVLSSADSAAQQKTELAIAEIINNLESLKNADFQKAQRFLNAFKIKNDENPRWTRIFFKKSVKILHFLNVRP